jgi:hypothetical protein
MVTTLMLDGTIVGYADLKDGRLEVFMNPAAGRLFDELWPPKLMRDGQRVSFGGRRGGQLLFATAEIA